MGLNDPCAPGCTYQGISLGAGLGYSGGACNYDPSATWQPAGLSCPTSVPTTYACNAPGFGCTQLGVGTLGNCNTGPYTSLQDCINNSPCTS